MTNPSPNGRARVGGRKKGEGAFPPSRYERIKTRRGPLPPLPPSRLSGDILFRPFFFSFFSGRQRKCGRRRSRAAPFIWADTRRRRRRRRVCRIGAGEGGGGPDSTKKEEGRGGTQIAATHPRAVAPFLILFLPLFGKWEGVTNLDTFLFFFPSSFFFSTLDKFDAAWNLAGERKGRKRNVIVEHFHLLQQKKRHGKIFSSLRTRKYCNERRVELRQKTVSWAYLEDIF